MYNENNQLNNYYTQLKFTGINYDSHCHKYLGEYLRYLRDYKDLNLMQLYNCYSEEFAEKLYIYKGKQLLFSTEDKNYKYIMVPVKLDQKYTIAIDCNCKYDIFCILYGRSAYTTQLFEATHQKISSSSFSNPYIYEGLLQKDVVDILAYKKLKNTHSLTDLYKKVAECEKDLKLIIKLPSTNTSSIVVLEGDYVSNNDFIFNTKITQSYVDPFKPQYNSSVINFKPELEPNETFKPNDIPLISSLQLLSLNSSFSYPFADRLIEYLTDNVICNTETISDNIKRVQKSLYNEYLEKDKQGLSTNWGRPNMGPHYGL